MKKSNVRNNRLPHVALSPVIAGNEASIIQALLCSTGHGILMTDHQGADIVCNPRFGELFDIDTDMVVHSSREDVRRIALERVDDPAEFVALLERIYADPTIEREDEITVKTTPPRVLRRYTGPVRDSNGVNIGRVWTFEDITETRRLQAEVQEYAVRLEAQFSHQARELEATTEVMNAMTAISASIASRPDLPDLVTAITRAISPLLGHEAAALMVPDGRGQLAGAISRGSGCTDVSIAEEDDAAVMAAMTAARCQEPTLALNRDHNGPLAIAMGSGDAVVAGLRWLDVPLGVIAFGCGGEAAIVDEFHRPHLEAIVTQVALALRIHRGRVDLQKAYDELRMAQEQLIQSEKLGAIGVMAASIAHDIRNIMTPLRMEMDLAASDPNIAGARAQLDRLSALTHRLLSLNRPPKIHPGPVCLRELIHHILPLIRPQAEIDRIAIRTRFAKDLPLVMGDSVRLEQLFINLFLNALNAMQAAGGTLTVTAQPEEQAVRVDVKDTGRGIAPKDVNRIFDPFFTTRANGAGLGLFSVQRIVEEHAGRISVRSRQNQGTQFSVWLPTAEK